MGRAAAITDAAGGGQVMKSAVVLSACAAVLIGLELASCSPNETEAAAPSAESAILPEKPAAEGRAAALEPYSCGTVQRLHTWNGIFAGSQPAADDLRHAQENKIKTVINLRPSSEDTGFDEAALVAELGLEYHNIPFAAPEELTDAVFEQARALLRDETKRPVFLHCHSGNRVGAIWLAFRALDGGLAFEDALEEAQQVGLKSAPLEQRAREYVERVRG
jgi:uncharacterized protein (TIGR01244 family)